MPQGTPREAFLGVSIMRSGCQAIVPPLRDAPSKQIFSCPADAARTYTDRPTHVWFCPHGVVGPLFSVPVAVGPKAQSQVPSGSAKGPEPDTERSGQRSGARQNGGWTEGPEQQGQHAFQGAQSKPCSPVVTPDHTDGRFTLPPAWARPQASHGDWWKVRE